MPLHTYSFITQNDRKHLHKVILSICHSTDYLRILLYNVFYTDIVEDCFILSGLMFFYRATLRSAVMLRQIVCPSVRLSVRDVEVSCSHRLEIFKNNFAVS